MNQSNTRIIAAQLPFRAYLEAGQEPSIAEVLAEPIVRAVMRRDAISEAALIVVIDRAREQLELRAA
jgi:hypothetical protein